MNFDMPETEILQSENIQQILDLAVARRANRI